MNLKRHIPNLITLGNLLFGTIAVIFAVNNDFEKTALFVVLGIFLDFFDGFFARILNVQGELGKQLDSLADMVTSGVVPGIVMYKLLEMTLHANSYSSTSSFFENEFVIQYLPYFGLLLTLGACYRLAKFNIDERQSDSFIGMPTPAMSLFVVFLPIINYQTDVEWVINLLNNSWFYVAVTILLTYVMNAELSLLSLKFKSYKLQGNLLKYLLILGSLILIYLLHYASIPVIILFYLVLSVINNISK